MIRTTAASALVALTVLAGVPVSASPTDDVRAAMLRFAALSSYEMTHGTGSRQFTIDFVKPDSVRMFGGPMEMVRIGTTTYVKSAGRGWMKIPGMQSSGVGPAAMSDRVRSLARDANAVTATDLGMKSVDGESLHAYRITTKDGKPTTVYIGSDGLFHRFDSGSGPDGAVRLGKFNAVAPIRAPI